MIDREFDIASSNGLPPGQGEGHAHAFVRKRLMEDQTLPVVPVFLNTYYPPNQPTPRRCWKLGQAIRAAVESWPGDARIGIVGSGGLSHFVVDEELDRGIIDALRAQGRRGAAIIAAQKAQFRQLGDPHVDRVGGAVEHLDMAWSATCPATAPRPGRAPGSALPCFVRKESDCHSGARAQPASPETMNTGLRKLAGLVFMGSGPALRASGMTHD